MRVALIICLSIFLKICIAQKTENLIVITTDGLRWQEVFAGMDVILANNKAFNQGDSSYIYNHYWNENSLERRKQLMPFLWSTIEKSGQIYGNRLYGNNVNNANPYFFSYPGYSEMMTGYVDTLINTNKYKANPNVNVLEFINAQQKFKGKVSAFGAWIAFDRILNEERCGFPVISAFDKVGGKNPSEKQKLINEMLEDSYKPFLEDECLDVYTNYEALVELKTKKPKVIYIAYGETDEWAHAGQYRSYLDAAHQVDSWIKQLWEMLQNDPQYKNKTTLLFTTDHGRGDKQKEQWVGHGTKIPDSSEIWFAVMGPEIKAKGEVKVPMQIYQKQFAQTISKMLGFTFVANHPIAPEIVEINK